MRAFGITAGWSLAALIIWLSLTPTPPDIGVEEGDKIGHFLAYGSLMCWFCLLYPRRATRVGYALLWIAMGIGLEFAQVRLGYRHYEIYDMYANTLGVLIGWALAFAIPMGVLRKLR